MTEPLLLGLRELLYEKPSLAVWGQLWRRLHEFNAGQASDAHEADPVALETAVEYAASHLEGWPCSYRAIRYQSHHQWEGKRPPAQLPLARHVVFAVGHPQAEDLREWCASPWCHPIESLQLTSEHNVQDTNLTHEAMEALLSSPAMRSLKRLKITAMGVPASAFSRLSQHPAAASLERLELLFAGFDQESARLLARSPHIRSLSHLNLCHNTLNGEGLQVLLESPCIPGLKALLLQGNEITDDGVEALSSAPFAQLETLFLGQNRIWSGGLYSLARATQLETLKHLDLRHISLNRGGSNILEAIGNMNHLKGLRRLSLCGATPDIEDLGRFASRVEFPFLESLDVSDNALRDIGLMELLEGSLCRHVQTLELRRCEIDAVASYHLANSPILRQLKHLGLADNPLDISATGELLRSEQWGRSLRSLDLSRIVVDYEPISAWDIFATQVAEAPALAGLTELRLAGDRIGEAGLRALLASPQLTELRRLDLSSNLLGLNAMADDSRPEDVQLAYALAMSPIVPKLQVLLLTDTRISMAALQALFDCPQLQALRHLHLGHVYGSLDEADAWLRDIAMPSLTELQVTFATSGDDLSQIPYDWPEDAEERLLQRSDLFHLSKVRMQSEGSL